MARERRPGLQAQLLLTVGLVALAAVAAVGIASRYRTRQEFGRLRDLERRDAAGRVDALAGALAGRLDGRCCRPDQLAEARGALGGDLVLLVLGDDGRVAGSEGSALAGLDRLTARRLGPELEIDASRGDEATGLERITLRFLQKGAALRTQDGGPARLYVLPFPRQSGEREAAFLGTLDRELVGATVLAGLAALGATWLIARRMVRPLARLAAASRAIAAGRFGERVTPGGGREVRELASAFNAMAGELERQQSLRRRLVTDVAHELRTPLTALQCRLEALQDGLAADPSVAVAQAHDEVRHLTRLVADLHELALAEARELRLETEDVPLDRVAASAVAAAGLESDPRLELAVPAGVWARGDAARLRQMLLNLLTNAARHTPPDGRIAVRAEAERDGVAVTVANTGSRLEPSDAARIFERFYRADPARQRHTGGSGLGLAIVKQLAEAQGGAVRARSDDAGVEVGFTLPGGRGRE